MRDAFLLIKRGLYWRPQSAGYTGVKAEAGRYSREEAEARCHHEGDPLGVTMVAEAEAPDFSAACYDDVKVRVLTAEVERLRALREIVETEARIAQEWADVWSANPAAGEEGQIASAWSRTARRLRAALPPEEP